MNKDINLVGNYLQSQIDQITNIVYGIGNNQTLTTAITAYIKDPSNLKYIELNSTMMDKLNEIQVGSNELVSSIGFVVRDQVFHNYTRTLRQNIEVQQILAEATEAQYAYPYILLAQENPFFLSSTSVIPLVYRYEVAGEYVYLVVLWDANTLVDTLDRFANYDSFFVFDERGRCVLENDFSSDDIHQLQALNPTEDTYTALKIDKRKVIATVSQLTKPRWTIVSLKDERIVLRQARQLLYSILLIYAAVYVVISTALYFVSRSITRPLIHLASIMESQTPWNYSRSFEYSYNDEIGTLTRAYQLMMSQIQEDEKQIAWEQREKRIAEINALQAQINPHFLYNTLNSIAWLAIDQGANDSANLATLLASYYRTSLSKGQEFITIKEEIAHVKHYLQIQQIRYPDLLDFEITVDEECLSNPVVRIILQPLVENAIYHGIKPLGKKGFIHITAQKRAEATIEIRVEDNGVGLSKANLDTINKHLHDGVFYSDSGYGIYNVNARLRLTYGAEYGLILESEESVKTASVVTIPYVLKKEEDDD